MDWDKIKGADLKHAPYRIQIKREKNNWVILGKT
jgi:hypothetical protein